MSANKAKLREAAEESSLGGTKAAQKSGNLRKWWDYKEIYWLLR
jgi:hypothetical protein